MAEKHGRTMTLKKAGTKIAGLRQKGFSWSGEPIDITDDDDGPQRELLAGGAGSESFEYSVEGLWKDSTLRDLVMTPSADKLLDDVTLEFADGGTLACDVFISGYEESGSYQDAVTFSATLMSSGPWTYTAPV